MRLRVKSKEFNRKRLLEKERDQVNDTTEQRAAMKRERNNGVLRATTDWSGMEIILTRQLEDITSRALEEGLAKGTRTVMITHLTAWRRFCTTVGVDEETFG